MVEAESKHALEQISTSKAPLMYPSSLVVAEVGRKVEGGSFAIAQELQRLSYTAARTFVSSCAIWNGAVISLWPPRDASWILLNVAAFPWRASGEIRRLALPCRAAAVVIVSHYVAVS